MRKIQFETRTHQERSKKIFLLFIAPPAKFRQLYNKDTPSGIWNLWHILHSQFVIPNGKNRIDPIFVCHAI
jgi:hypothetical protein